MSNTDLLKKFKKDLKTFKNLAKKDVLSADKKAEEILKDIPKILDDKEIISNPKLKKDLEKAKDYLLLFRDNSKQIVELNKKYGDDKK